MRGLKAAVMECCSTPIDVSVVIVNWNTRQLLQECLATLRQQSGVRCEVFVVDNGSTDGSVEAVAAGFPEVTLLRADENWGFARANNRAFPQCQGQYVLLLNPDTLVPAGALRAMARYLDQDTEVGAVGCELRNPDGSVQSGPRSFPTVWATALQVLLGVPPRARRGAGETCDVDWLSGACLMVRRSVIADVGGLREEYFMYVEDTEWCYRMRRRGWRLVYHAGVHIVHLLGQSNRAGSQFYTVHDYRNKLAFFSSAERGALGKLKLLALRAAYVLGGIARLAAYGLLRVLRPAEPYYRDRTSAYRAVIRIGVAGR